MGLGAARRPPSARHGPDPAPDHPRRVHGANFIPKYNRAIDVTGDAAVVFVGASMLLAAARGYAGCEVLAISNWLLRRDDRVGCIVFAPVDFAESRRWRHR